MRLTSQHLARFHEDGFLVLPGLFSPEEVEIVGRQLTAVFTEDTPANIREKSGGPDLGGGSPFSASFPGWPRRPVPSV